MDFPEREDIINRVRDEGAYINTYNYFSPVFKKGDLEGFFVELQQCEKQLIDIYKLRRPYFILDANAPLEKVYIDGYYHYIIKMKLEVYKGKSRKRIENEDVIIDLFNIRGMLFMTFYREIEWVRNYYPYSQTKSCR